jgi:hypothetical protein
VRIERSFGSEHSCPSFCCLPNHQFFAAHWRNSQSPQRFPKVDFRVKPCGLPKVFQADHDECFDDAANIRGCAWQRGRRSFSRRTPPARITQLADLQPSMRWWRMFGNAFDAESFQGESG